jgi:predicted kinase
MPTLVLVTGPPGTGKSTLAEAAAAAVGGPVLAWDWAMAGLTGFDDLQKALAGLDRLDYRRVGWSILWNLAVAQLRAGRGAVLDGCARAPEVEETRRLAAAEGAEAVTVLTSCRDRDTHRDRIVGRVRAIPGWYELAWDHVSGFLDRWEPPDADLALDATDPLHENVARLTSALAAGSAQPARE